MIIGFHAMTETELGFNLRSQASIQCYSPKERENVIMHIFDKIS